MAMRKLNRCPRCGGYMFLDMDGDNWYVNCLQCSYQYDLGNVVQSEKQTISEKKESISERGS